MIDLENYTPGPAGGTRVRRDGEKWTLIITRELRHPPEIVWQAITEPAHLREWAPFDADGSLARSGDAVRLTWTGTTNSFEITVTQADPPRLLEYGDMRWELEPLGSGTRLTLWHSIDRRFVTWGAAGWHIALDVLQRFLDGKPVGRIAGANARNSQGFQRLVADYAKQFAAEPPAPAP